MPEATECLTGITCPEGTRCAAAQPVCITNNCGDGFQQSTETCDDGNILDGDGCSADCRSTEVCGDRIVSTAADELCDDGNTDGGDGCSADCKSVEICGNGIRDVNEVCDDMNTLPGDGCSGNCKSTEICGNGIVDINEICDDMGAPGGCNDDCQGGTGCGDGAIDKDGSGMPLEECDDGNGFDDDDCIACKLSACGDTFVQIHGSRFEECDPGAAGETALCNIDCTSAGCGDGKINNVLMEQCDDENAVDEDACKNDCTLNYCGDGIEGGPNEACDTGGASATCDADCSGPMCGDGVVNALFNEDCDTGGVNTMTCDANCTAPLCGDGTVNTAAGEACDDGNTNNGDNCRNDCKFNVCGDHYIDTELARVEVCDDGNAMTEPSCPYGTLTCSVCNDTCTMLVPKTGAICGDNTTNSSDGEMCDDGNRVTEASCPYGQPTCTNLCSADCKMPLSLTGLYCGDGAVTTSAGEACDDYNGMACGRCDASCNMFATAAATGYIVASTGMQISDDDTLTINDGFGHVAVFEFDKDASGPSDTNMTNLIITTANTDTADQMHTKLRNAINGVPGFLITASDGGNNLVLLTHDRKSSLGNLAITDTIGSSDFIVSGMAGGAGGDCGAGIGCAGDDDCQSGNCSNHVCQ